LIGESEEKRTYSPVSGDTRGVYRERRSRLRGSTVWHRVSDGGTTRILPDGAMDLIVTGSGGLIVAGPDTIAQPFSSAAGDVWTGLRFAPGVGPTVLGIPAHELRDRRVPLDALWPAADVRRLAGAVALAEAPGAVLEAAAEDRLRRSDPVPPVIGEIVRLLRRGWSVGEVARVVNLSPRQLQRRSVEAFGYGPKTLARILRLSRAVELARRGTPFVDVATGTGYADQAHLAHDARALAGVSLGELTR
jgi:AraC-like DNA-binding protein